MLPGRCRPLQMFGDCKVAAITSPSSSRWFATTSSRNEKKGALKSTGRFEKRTHFARMACHILLSVPSHHVVTITRGSLLYKLTSVNLDLSCTFTSESCGRTMAFEFFLQISPAIPTASASSSTPII